MNQLTGSASVEPSCKSKFCLLLFLLLSATWFRSFFFFRLSEPRRDASRWDQPSRQMRVDGADVDNQSLIEPRSCEVLGFRFSLKSSGCPRATPSWQDTAFLHLKSHVPGIRHRSPEDDAPGMSRMFSRTGRSNPSRAPAGQGQVLVARWVGIVSAAWRISSVGSSADGSSANPYRHSTAYGRAAVNAAAIDASVMNTSAAYANASTAAICERISRNHGKAGDADHSGSSQREDRST
jgi:hypothetical protein